MNKIGLLICDDEWMIREQIARGAERQGGFDVFMADSGLKALDVLEHQCVDGVVLDIRMPEMDGIALLKEIRKRNSEPVVIILSGHDEFDYAQQSLNFGATEYILKPVTEEQIDRFLNEMKERILRKVEYVSMLDKYKHKLESIRPVLREQYFRDVIQRRADTSDMKQIEDFLGIRIRAPFIVCAVIRVTVRNAVPGDSLLRLYAVEELLEMKLEPDGRTSVFVSDCDSLCVLSGGESQNIADALNLKLESLLEPLSGDLAMGFSVGIGTVVQSLERVRESYAKALYAVNSGDSKQMVSIISIGDILGKDRLLDKKEDIESAIHGMMFSSEIMNGSNYLEELKGLLKQIRECPKIDFDDAIFYCSEICFLALDVLGERRELLRKNPMFALASKTNPDELFDTAETLIAEVCEAQRLQKQNRICRLADSCQELIEREYSKKIDLSEIAGKLGVSRNYLSTVFKREKDYGVIEYLNAVRLQQARKLLRSTDLKIYEIADRVGFSDVYYFSNAFKRIVGVSPSEYRDNLLE